MKLRIKYKLIKVCEEIASMCNYNIFCDVLCQNKHEPFCAGVLFLETLCKKTNSVINKHIWSEIYSEALDVNITYKPYF